MPLVSKNFSDIITFSRASTATYFDATGTLQSAAIDTPRFDYDPATLAARGFLIEESRTNSIRNNTMQGAVAGTPGTFPTNWDVVVSGSGITRELVGTGTEDGITYVDLRFYGTGSGTATPQIRPETTTNTVSAVGQTWTASYYLRIVGGSTTGITSWAQIWQERDAAGISLTTATAAFSAPTTAALKTQRSVTTRTLTDAAAVRLTNRIQWAFVDGVAVDITLRIGLPQLEGGLGSSVNSGTASGTTTAVVLSAGSATDDIYNGNNLLVNGEYRVITDYVGSTKTATVSPALSVSPSGGYTVFAVGNAAFATSVIPTSGSALTRAADVASVNTLSPWFNATEGTLFMEAAWPYVGLPISAANGIEFSEPTNTSYIQITRSGVGATPQAVFSGNTGNPYSGNVAANTAFKFAVAYKTDDAAVALNGVQTAGSFDTSLVVPTGLTQLRFGKSVVNTSKWLSRVTYYPRRLSNAELQAITA